MKHLLFFSALFLFRYNTKSDYLSLNLYEMIIKADKIVYGTISELDSNYFTLQLKGSFTSDSGDLRIKKAHDWAYASRSIEYEVGQQLLLFLTNVDGELMSMGGKNEGELPILDNVVYIYGLTIPIPPPPSPPGVKLSDDLVYFKTQHFDIYGGNFYGIKWKLDSFIESVIFIRKHFNFDYGQFEIPSNWEINCDEKELEEMCSKSKLVKWVYNTASKSEKK